MSGPRFTVHPLHVRVQRTPFEWPGPAPALGGEEALIVVGDVHGRLDLTIALHDAVDVAFASGPSPLEIYLGDVVDRGPDSFGVIEALLRRQAHRRLTVLSGNHEDMVMAALAGAPARTWLAFGGLETIRSYGLRFGFGGIDVEAWRECVPAAHRDFLETMVPRVEVGDLVCIHDPQSLGPADRTRPVVHGHNAAERPRLVGRHLNIDTGAYATGRLTVLTWRLGRFELWTLTNA